MNGIKLERVIMWMIYYKALHTLRWSDKFWHDKPTGQIDTDFLKDL